MNEKPVHSSNFGFNFSDQTVSFDPEAFDRLITSQGVDMVHYSAMPCPIGKVDANDPRHPEEHHFNCSNGFIYAKTGSLIAGFLGNSKRIQQMNLSQMDSSTVEAVFPRFYDETCEPGCPDNYTQIVPFDRLYLKDEAMTVLTWEEKNYSQTSLEKLRYPIVRIIHLVDSLGKQYVQGTDYTLVDGKISWINNPGMEPSTSKGRVISIRYSYRPFWYVQTMIHELRVAQVEDETGRHTQRFPQAAILQREYVFENVQRDRKATDDPRQVPVPETRGYSNDTSDLGTGR